MLVLIRGAGDLASGIALRLRHARFDVVMTETGQPTTIRRTVAFSDAVSNGEATVEDVRAVRAADEEGVREAIAKGEIPILVDPACECLGWLKPDVLVDAILAKKNLGTKITDAPVVIGVGPGFTANVDCHACVETMRGHTLGRVIRKGSPLPNTNIPGLIGGFAGERVMRAPADGPFVPVRKIGDLVKEGDVVGTVNGEPMRATIPGNSNTSDGMNCAAITG